MFILSGYIQLMSFKGLATS